MGAADVTKATTTHIGYGAMCDEEVGLLTAASRPKRSMALPSMLQPYIEHISVFIIVAFFTIIVFTIWVDIADGMQS